MVTGCDRATGWLLTEEGTVDGVFDNQRASGSDSKWTLHVPPLQWNRWNHSFEVGVVQVLSLPDPGPLLRYDIETGDVLKFAPKLRHSRSTSPQPPTQGRSRRHLHLLPYLMILSPKTVGSFQMVIRQRQRG